MLNTTNIKIKITKLVIISLVLTVLHSSIFAIDSKRLIEPVYGTQGMVSSQEAIATDVGLEILKKGGNAIDSAVAIGFALAVTYPQAGNLGGGGFMMVYLAELK
ncbi:MAG: gamma-glutamyltranspeptidase/glutathione hydrolase, partial [Enterobacterales bacterium]